MGGWCSGTSISASEDSQSVADSATIHLLGFFPFRVEAFFISAASRNASPQDLCGFPQ
ncbi:hypothetical protein THF5H11_60109 [Vibrio jasicida]|nr:hypothetical protein THF5H11_60109 [Vibrio jasicida]